MTGQKKHYQTVLLIEGFSRTAGYTKKICEAVTAYLQPERLVRFLPYETAFRFCDGCNFCEENGHCRFSDLDDFFREFEQADLVLFASPVYNSGFSAPMKALLDRFQVYYTGFFAHGKVQQIKKERDAVLLSASGCDGERAVRHMSEDLRCSCSVLHLRYLGFLHCPHTDTHPDFSAVSEKIPALFSEGAGK